MTTSSAGYAIVGRIRKAHGIHGECVVEPLTDAPDVLFASGRRVFAGTAAGDLAVDDVAGRSAVPGLPPSPDEPTRPSAPVTAQSLSISGARAHQGGLLVTFSEIADRNTAEQWRGRYLLVPIDEIAQPAEGEVFLHELPGMTATFEDGSSAGVIETYYELPHGILLGVMHEGKEVLVPFAGHVVTGVDRVNRRVTLRPPEGLFE